MARPAKLTRAGRRACRADDEAGVHGVDVTDAGADSWTGRYLCWAASSDEARTRIRDAGFHARGVRARWAPGHLPGAGVAGELRPGDRHWYRSRLDDAGWTAWERLPATYRHPPQGQAATDPSLR